MSSRNGRIKLLLQSACFLAVCMPVSQYAIAPTEARAAAPWKPTGKTLEWSANTSVTLDTLDCVSAGYTGIVVTGTVTLVHPHPDSDQAQQITLRCPYIVFTPSSQILTKEELHLRVSEQAVGDIKIINTRGENGADADLNEAILARRKQVPETDGKNGPNGRDARTDIKGDWSAERGDNGERGKDGPKGENGVKGEPGHGGKSAAQIYVRIANFADGSTITMRAIGGKGGTGGKGGRGEDGGDGGKGGNGGAGGDGNAVHPGDSGGDGGDGGDGGRGGNGGEGGPGGPGGNGADTWLWTLEGGVPPDDIDARSDGGRGGRSGEGGTYGIEGNGVRGGAPGCGGSGGTFISIWHTGSGSCGTNGHPGKTGANGTQGPPGVWGLDGSPGHNYKFEFRALPRADF